MTGLWSVEVWNKKGMVVRVRAGLPVRQPTTATT